MATFQDFDGLIADFTSFGAPLNFKARVDSLTLTSYVRLAPNDISTLLDDIWHYYSRTLTSGTAGGGSEDDDYLLKPRN